MIKRSFKFIPVELLKIFLESTTKVLFLSVHKIFKSKDVSQLKNVGIQIYIVTEDCLLIVLHISWSSNIPLIF